MYKYVPRAQIADVLVHLRRLFRENKPSTEQEQRAQEKREVLAKNLLSNIFRTKDHPTLHSVLEISEIFSLTLDGAHRIFGYELENIRDYDAQFNGARTRIIESYLFERDMLIDLPFELGGNEVFTRNASLRDMVEEWQSNIPIRALEDEGWHRRGVFYVQVGTEDSLGSSLPPGSIALVQPVSEMERSRPDPRSIYLLQFGNGYRCSHCVVTRGKLLLLVSRRNYVGPQEFAYPAGVRIVGRIQMFALRLPVPEYRSLHPLPGTSFGAPLILPWEHSSLDRLLSAKHLRFRRPELELSRLREAMEAVFQTKLSARTERRYRRPTSSQPHVDALIQLAITHVVRYSDTLRLQHPAISDRARYSLEALLNAEHLSDVAHFHQRARPPVPPDRWLALRKRFVEWPMLLSLKFPHLRPLDDKIHWLPQGAALEGLDPPISAGSLVLLDKVSDPSQIDKDREKSGWSRRVYAFRRGAELVFGYLATEGNRYILLTSSRGTQPVVSFGQDEFDQLCQVSGLAVPV